MVISFIEEEIGFWHLDLEEVLAAREVQGARFRKRTGAALEEICDVLAGEGLEGESVFHRASHRFDPVDIAQGHDLAQMMAGIEAPLLQFLVVLLCPWGERQETHQELLFACVAALLEERARMVGILDVLMALVAAEMPGNELLAIVDTQAIGIGLQRYPSACVLGGHGIAVGIEGDAELLGGAYGSDRADIVRLGREGFEMCLFCLETFRRSLVGLAMEAYIGDGVERAAGFMALKSAPSSPFKKFFLT
jgi:hypothetical protein